MRVDIAHGFVSETENNSTTGAASAITLTPGAAGHAVGLVSGYVSAAADTDHFALGNLRADDVVDLFVVKPTSSTLDPRVQLIVGTSGAVLASATGSGHATFTVPADGLYYAQVAANTGASAGVQALYLLNVNITDVMAPTVLSTTLPTAYSAGSAVTFDGVNDYINVPDSASLRPTSLTLEGWVNFAAVGGTRLLFSKVAGTGTSDSYAVWHDGSNLRAVIGDAAGTGTQLAVGFTPTVGQWYHIAFTFDNNSRYQALYVNGALVASGISNKSIGYDANPLQIGVEYENQALSFWFAGSMDEIRLWNTARSNVAIQTDMSRSLTGTETGLAGYWRFDDGAGLTAADATANHNNGVFGGITQYNGPLRPDQRTGQLDAGGERSGWFGRPSDRGERRCRERAYLVSTILTGLNANRAMWIGLNDQTTEGTFVWSTGEPSPTQTGPRGSRTTLATTKITPP